MPLRSANRMKALTWLGIGAVIVTSSWAAWRSRPSLGSIDSTEPSAAIEAESSLGAIGYFGDGLVAWSSDTEIQEYFLEQGTDVTITDCRLQEDDWVKSESTHSTAYAITAMSPRGKDELYLAGTSAIGETIIEKWKFKKVGKPNGTIFKVPVRTELYRGTGIAAIRQLSIDPELRFCLILAGQGVDSIVYRMPVISSAVPVAEYSHSPSLPIGDMLYISRYQHLSLGRVWELSKDPVVSQNGVLVDDTVILLIDGQNDGVFEDEIVGSAVVLYGTGVLRADMITNDFSG